MHVPWWWAEGGGAVVGARASLVHGVVVCCCSSRGGTTASADAHDLVCAVSRWAATHGGIAHYSALYFSVHCPRSDVGLMI